MLPSKHILLGALASLLIYFIFPQIGFLGLIIIFLSSFLIDIDHYLQYVYIKGSLSLINSYKYHYKNMIIWSKLSRYEKLKIKSPIFIFHGIEFIIFLILLIFLDKIFLFILIGILIHLIFDLFHLYANEGVLHSKISQIYTHIKNKKKKIL